MSLKTIKTILIVVLLTGGSLFATYSGFNTIVDWSNTEIALNNDFKAQKQQRIAFYDKMYKQVLQTSKIALRNDSSFYHIVDEVMINQPKNLNAMFGAIRLIDPSANYSQVSSFYQQLLEISNSNREGFFNQETALQGINKNHENHIKQFPGNVYNTYFKRESFNYQPIVSENTRNVEKTGIDNWVNPFE